MLTVVNDGGRRRQRILTPETIHQLRRNMTLLESCKKWREVREGRLDLRRDLQGSDDEMDTKESSETNTEDSQQLSEEGDIGGVVCPVCCRHWYTINADVGCAVCEGCRLPVRIPLNVSSEHLRLSVKEVLREHNSACSKLPDVMHLADGDAYSVICICDACDYLNLIF